MDRNNGKMGLQAARSTCIDITMKKNVTAIRNKSFYFLFDDKNFQTAADGTNENQ